MNWWTNNNNTKIEFCDEIKIVVWIKNLISVDCNLKQMNWYANAWIFYYKIDTAKINDYTLFQTFIWTQFNDNFSVYFTNNKKYIFFFLIFCHVLLKIYELQFLIDKIFAERKFYLHDNEKNKFSEIIEHDPRHQCKQMKSHTWSMITN